MRAHQLLARLLSEVDDRIDRVRHSPERLMRGRRRIRIVPYLGFGTSDRVWVTGRVVASAPVRAAEEADSRWRNLLHMYRRMRSGKIPHARLRATLGGVATELTADDEGYYATWLAHDEPTYEHALWHDVSLDLLAPLRPGHEPVHATGKVLIPPRSASFGVISDIDDTVIQTDATSLLRMARTVLLGNARTRLPFAGVAAFYRALQRGDTGHAGNPLFYVSSSPWNLFDLLIEFFELEGIPLGPLMLRDWGVSRDELFPNRHGPHKLESIERILSTYTGLPFILVGDSGQEDPEIYSDVVHRYGDRIRAVYIRNVTGLARASAVHALSREVVSAGSSLVLADDTLAAARHAAGRGWMAPSALSTIGDACREDEAGDAGTPVAEHGRRREDTPTMVIAVQRQD